jgi:hypothetical protein
VLKEHLETTNNAETVVNGGRKYWTPVSVGRGCINSHLCDTFLGVNGGGDRLQVDFAVDLGSGLRMGKQTSLCL